jgi:hypothetical protein
MYEVTDDLAPTRNLFYLDHPEFNRFEFQLISYIDDSEWGLKMEKVLVEAGKFYIQDPNVGVSFLWA